MNVYFTKRVLDFPLDSNHVLLINTISSAMDIVDKSTYAIINKMATEDIVIDPQLLQDLKQRGYVFDNEESEIKQIEKCSKIYQKIQEKTFVKNYTICPTMGCNLRCVYCFEGDENHCNHELMSVEKLDAILKYIANEVERAEQQNMSTEVTISLYGGEPLLPQNKEIVKKTLEFAHKKNIEVRIITNGTTIDYYLQLLKKHSKTTIQITLDGDKSIHDKRRITANKKGTFDDIVTGIDKLVQSGLKVHLRTNADAENLSFIPNLIQFIREKGWIETGLVFPYIAPVFDYCSGSDNSMPESYLYYKLLKIEPDVGSDTAVIKRISSPCLNFLQSFFNETNEIKPWKMSYCEATSGKNLVFSPDGNIFTCLMLAGKSKYQIGYFDEHGIKISSEQAKLWNERDILRLPKCKICKFAMFCGGGCPVAALNINSDIDCPVCSDIENTMKVYIESKKEEILKGL